jgi:hypothetical protein
MLGPVRWIHASWTRDDTCRAATIAVAGLTTLIACGCNHQVYSPPARLMPLESAATLGAGETGIQLEGGAHGAIFGPSGESGTLRVRHGIEEGTDVSMEASAMHIDGNAVAGTYPYLFAGRAGLKHEALPWLSLTAGLGGGASAGGGFVSPDVGVIVAYENRYAVPFFSLRASASVPFDTHPVDTGQAGSDAVGRWVYTPPLTWIGGGSAGLRIPLGWCDHAPCPVRGSLLGALALTYLGYDGASTGVVSLAGGGEIVF